ncbi:MAG: tetratricopeptide repeat protein [Synergistaceae bacterium]|nr:tetratricopeptide repeat protein [Synergistaceae bacterium]
MKKILAILIFIISANSVIYAAETPIEDDSTPYMPYPERIEIIKEVPAQPAPKTQTKQSTTKKKTTTKKANTTKKSTKKTTKRTSSLERGIALMNEERYEAARPYLQKAIQEERNNPNAWYWYGVYHEKTGKYTQAQYFYSKAVTIDPTLEPLSRVVYYPNDAEKTPLWDSKRPARVYPVATKNDGVTIGSGNFPTAPNDPEIPKVPVYIPPQPDSNPTDGDNWAPALYVPPTPREAQENTVTNAAPVYNPPQPIEIEAEYTYKIPGYSNTYAAVPEKPDVRADLPLYTPPEPGKIVAQTQNSNDTTRIKEAKPAVAKKTTGNKSAPRKIVKKSTQTQKQNTKRQTPAKKQVTSESKKTTEIKQTKQNQQTQPKKQQTSKPQEVKQEVKKQETKPTIKESTKKEQPKKVEKVEKKVETTPKTQVSKPKEPEQKQNVQPKPTQKTTPKAPEPKVVEREPIKPVVHDEEPQGINQHVDYLPPVGQAAPDPGTIVEPEIPPVGQNN